MFEALRVWVRWCSVLSLALGTGNCSSQSSGTDTRTNWLMACDETAECGGEFACLCGVCTVRCESSAACAGLGETAACFEVNGCRGVAAVCSTPEVEQARAEGSGSASNEGPRPDAGGVTARYTASLADVSWSSATLEAGSMSAEPAPSATASSSNAMNGADSNGLGSNGADSDGPDSNVQTAESTGCSPSAAGAGLCGNADVCEAGEVLPTTEPCELTGFVTRECAGGQWIDTCTSCQRVALADPALEQAIRDTLAKPTGELTLTDAAQLTTLLANGVDIADLEGIECFTNLTFVDLSGNSIGDVSPLGRLTALTDLGLTQNQIADMKALSSLGALEALWIASNAITDLAPLVSLTNLRSVGVSSNAISDLAPLAEITTLTDVDLSYNTFSSIEPIRGLTALRTLTLGPSPAFDGDLSPLAAFTQLEMLFLSDCGLEDPELTPLSGLTYLDLLDLTFNDIVDVAALSAYSNTTLTLNDNPLDCDSASLAALEAQNFMTYTDCP